jgi:signal transduction histidine kinase
MRASRAKSAFLSRASHELRTPLNAVLGFAQLMESDEVEPLTTGQRKRVNQVLESGQQLLELINDILDLTGLEGETLDLHPSEFALAGLIEASLDRVRAMARSASVDLAWSAEGEPPTVHADARRLEQSLVHLLSNAVKYNHPGGRVDVRVRCTSELAMVSVRDTGCGMSHAQLDRLFQPFDRLGAEGTKVRGSGLGLVIARQLLRRMGGDLLVTSEEGRGTCAELSIPLASVAPAPQGPRRMSDSFVARVPTFEPAGHAAPTSGGAAERLGHHTPARQREEPGDRG